MSRMALLSALVLAACTQVGPDHAPPSMTQSKTFLGGSSAPLADAPSKAWWLGLHDPLLAQFIKQGLAQNLDLAIALERIRESQAALRASGASFATGDLTAEGTRSDAGGGVVETETYQATTGFVLDLFGGRARATQQSRAALQATKADLGVARLAFLTEITDAYIQARYYQATATIQRQTIASRRRTLETVESRAALGDATELDLQRARADLAVAQAELPLQVTNFETSVFRIATLLATGIAPTKQAMVSGRAIPRPQRAGAVGVPADLLRNRPDILAAERRLVSATAAVGVSTAQLYPAVLLNGSVTLGTSEQWSFGPRVTLPVLNRGALTANRDAALSRAAQAEQQWRKSVLKAVEEVETALAQLAGSRNRLASQQRAARALEQVTALTRTSYEAGETPLTDLLDVERQLASARLSVADAERNTTLAWMRLQVATGQGWLWYPSNPKPIGQPEG